MGLLLIFIGALALFCLGLFFLIFGINKSRLGSNGVALIILGILLMLINGYIVGIFAYFYIGLSTGLIRLM